MQQMYPVDFPKPTEPNKAHQIAEQDARVPPAERMAQHLHRIHEIMEHLDRAIEANDPDPKFEMQTLDPTVEFIVRYEGRTRYAMYTTETAGTKFTAQWAGKQWTITTTAPGWQALDYPAGTLLYSGDANRHLVLIRMSNMKV